MNGSVVTGAVAVVVVVETEGVEVVTGIAATVATDATGVETAGGDGVAEVTGAVVCATGSTAAATVVSLTL